jgi:hypothetical protein
VKHATHYKVYADALPSKAALHVWDLVLWSAHSSDAFVGPGSEKVAAAAVEALPLVHPARCVLLWVALGLVASLRVALEDAKLAGNFSLEGAIGMLKAAAAQTAELGAMQGPELGDVVAKADAIAAKVLRDRTAAKVEVYTDTDAAEEEEKEKEKKKVVEEEEEEEEEGSTAVDEPSSALAALEALAQSDSSEEASDLEVKDDDAPDDLIRLLTEFGLEALYAVLASAARGKSAQKLLALGQKRVVALGVPFIKARKLWAKAEAMAVQAESQTQFGDALFLSPVRETPALPSQLLPETPVDQRGSELSKQPASVLSPETPGGRDSSTGGLNSHTQTSQDAADESTDELAALLKEFGLGSLHAALATAAKGTSARQLLALGQKEAAALGVPFLKARKLWTKAEAVAAASPAVANAAGPPHAASGGSKSKWQLAAKEAVEMRHEDEAAAAEMSALMGLVVAPSPFQAKVKAKGSRHFADVVLDAFEANALAAVKKSARLLLRRKLGWRREQAMYTRVS